MNECNMDCDSRGRELSCSEDELYSGFNPPKKPALSFQHFVTPVAPVSFSQIVSNSPPKIPPIIVSAVRAPKYFKRLDYAGVNAFVKKLENLSGSVLKVEVAFGGDLFVFPKDNAQKNFLMSLNKIGELEISCNRTRSETHFRGVISGIPTSEEDDQILSCLRDQDVIEAKRIIKSPNADPIPTETFILTFSKPLPLRVTLAYRSFPVRPIINRPMQCSKYYRIGHTAKHCSHDERCSA